MESLAAWLRLRHTRSISNASKCALVQAFGTAQAVFDATDADLAPILTGSRENVRSLRISPNEQLIAKDLAWWDAPRNDIITIADQRYPGLLMEIANPPLLLYVSGDVRVLTGVHLAMVGSRNPTPAGAATAYELSRDLAGAGVGITSGMALGIDAAAHRGALDAQGKTIAVAATGLDIVYPHSHTKLADAIKKQGLIISEFPITTPPKREHFPRRNRIISGLCLGTVVVEAAMRSGSLITARLAGEQGRDVFAVPGSIHSPTSKGCHLLIKQGAKLTETTADIMQDLGWDTPSVNEKYAENSVPEKEAKELDAAVAGLLQLVDYSPTTLDTLIERSGLTADVVSSMLLELELNGWVQAVPGGGFVRTAL